MPEIAVLVVVITSFFDFFIFRYLLSGKNLQKLYRNLPTVTTPGVEFFFVFRKSCARFGSRMDTDIGKPSTWIKFKPSLCQDCMGGCCTLPVEVSAGDLVRLGLLFEDETKGSVKKVASRLIKERVVQSFRAASGLFTLAQNPQGDCVFLDSDRRCRVYETRPEVCRKFPTLMGPRISFCPYQKKIGQKPKKKTG